MCGPDSATCLAQSHREAWSNAECNTFLHSILPRQFQSAHDRLSSHQQSFRFRGQQRCSREQGHEMPRKRWEPAPPDPGSKPDGLRERAERIAKARGWQPEDPEKTKQSQAHWAKFRAEQAAKNKAEKTPTGVRPKKQRRRSGSHSG
jgi:hypothetical protein